MTPAALSASLRSIADRVDNSVSPSKSAVAAAIRDLLASVAAEPPVVPVAAAAEKVFVSEDWWDLDQVEELMKEAGGSDLRECEYGLYGFMAPADAINMLKSEPGVSVFNNWDEANGTEPNLDFQPVDAKPRPVDL